MDFFVLIGFNHGFKRRPEASWSGITKEYRSELIGYFTNGLSFAVYK
jgi:hypothetical protein